MRALCASLLLLCAATTLVAEAADRSKLKELLSRRRDPAKTATRFAPKDARLAYQAARQRATLVTSADVVLPFVLNGEGITTRIRLVNMEDQPVELEMLFVDDFGVGAEVDIKGKGFVPTVKTTLAAGGSFTIETSGTGDEQLVWAFFDAGRNNVGATATIEVAEEQGTYGASYSAQYLGDTRVLASFDNTNGADSEISIISTDVDEEVEVSIRLRKEDGSPILATTGSIPPLGAVGFVPADEDSGAENVRGSVEISIPSDSRGGLAVVVVQFFESGFLTLLPGFSTVN
jgi:hypothetical protein